MRVRASKMADFTSLSTCQCLRFAVLWLLFVSGHCVQDVIDCMSVKKTYAAKGFAASDVPFQAVNGDGLDICPQHQTCCSRSMEDKLKSWSQKQHNGRLGDAFKLVKTLFASKTRKFDQFFTELLDNAREELHEMFVKTYGLLYQQNAQIFTDLFTDLRAYYKGKDRNLVDVMDTFFSRLLQRMFELLNGQYEFDDQYLTCVTERMNDLKPFGEVPLKLSSQIKVAFIAARTFVQGLAIGRDVILNIMEIPPTEACIRGFMKMVHCPLCQGLTQTKPCNNFCLNTMKGCLAHHAELNAVWNEYIDALKNLAKKLEGPFNIESVVDPIDVQISEAIMNLQENGPDVSQKIFSGCGQPQFARKKRAANKGDIYDFDFSSKPRARPTTAAGTSLDRLVRDIKDKVNTAKDFWLQLPYTVCNDEDLAASAGSEEDCWNGQGRARYIPAVQKDGVLNQINNPEVEVDVSKANALFTRQVIQLRLITSKLNSAYIGEDVDWIDTEIEAMHSSGSGSGSHISYNVGGGKGKGHKGGNKGRGQGHGGRGPNRNYGNNMDDNDFSSSGSGSGGWFPDDDEDGRDNDDDIRIDYGVTSQPPGGKTRRPVWDKGDKPTVTKKPDSGGSAVRGRVSGGLLWAAALVGVVSTVWHRRFCWWWST